MAVQTSIAPWIAVSNGATMGFAYNDAPQPQGYTMEPFDASNPEMLPAQPRGHFKKTLQMHREVLP